MNIINTLLGTPFGYVLYFAFLLTGSFGMAIVLFSITAKILLFPVMRIAHLNSIRLLRLQPELYVIKKRYAHDKEVLNEEQYNLFKKEKYNPLVGIFPLLVQLLLLMGMLQVMYDPLHHMRLPEGSDLHFLGINLGVVPSLRNPSIELIMPILSGFAAFAFSLVQNFISPGALSQGKKTNIGLIVFTVVLSVYFAAVTPAGVGLYWTVGNLFAIVTVTALYFMYNPNKLAAEALTFKKPKQKTPEEIKEEKKYVNALKLKEKSDVAKFLAADKKLVFYALTGGQYKYYKTIIDYVVENSDIVVHYLTNDPEDALFKMNNPQIIPYYVSQRKTLFLMLKLDADMVLTTVSDLQNFHIKRSVVRDDIEYVYVFHAPISSIVQYKETAFDHFDTILCVGPHHSAEMRQREELAKIKKRRLVKAGYGLYDQLLENYNSLHKTENKKTKILIAPSWQSENIFESCIDDILGQLIDRSYEIIVRPHPQFMVLFPERMEALVERYSANNEIIFELNFAGNDSIYTSDLIITDWSGIAYEFAYCTSKPCIFINTPPKITNTNYKQYGIEPMEHTIRNDIGISVEPADIREKLQPVIEKLLNDKGSFSEQIKETLSKYIYHPGRSGEAGGKYIIGKLKR
ncbi:MAG: membrane protein insertase YidC [Defluviitaleaceae bacterium]|nr:membrane protein insertase YidC [Defluviitaleaceae bacterium]